MAEEKRKEEKKNGLRENGRRVGKRRQEEGRKWVVIAKYRLAENGKEEELLERERAREGDG